LEDSAPIESLLNLVGSEEVERSVREEASSLNERINTHNVLPGVTGIDKSGA